MMAFALADKYTGKPYTDPRYVKWYASLGQVDKNGSNDYTGVPMHPCTKEDYSKFLPASDRSTEMINELKKQGGFYCIDWETANVRLRGTDSKNSYTFSDVNALPCHFRETNIGAESDFIRDDCVTDQ